jgi:HK97 family phage portal protein
MAGPTLFSRVKDFFIRSLSLNDPKSWDRSLWTLNGSVSLSGENVTEETALGYAPIWNAVSLISGTIGALPLHLMQRKGDAKRIADDRKMYQVMHDQWNPYMTAMAGRECLMAHVLTWGNGYAEKVLNGYGEVVQLWPITPNRVRPVMSDGELVYRITLPIGPDVILSREKVLHVPGLGFDGFMGYSVISMARKSIGLGMSMETFGSLYFGQGTHPGVIVSHPGKLGPEAYANMKGALTEAYSGLGQSHRLMLLEEGLKMEKVGIPNNDSQFLESRNFQIPEIARWFNLPPHKLKDLTRSSFSNIESEQISFVTDSILPWLVRLEQNYQMQLLSPSDREYSGRGRLYWKHSVEGLMRGSAATRAAFYGPMLDRGVFSINEVRALEDMDPILGGDIHLVPLNYQSLEFAGEKPDKTAAKSTPEKIPVPGSGNGQGAEKGNGQGKGLPPGSDKKGKLKVNIKNRKKDNVDWGKVYKKGNAHWADDMQPSKFAQEFAEKLIDEGKKSILEIGCGNGRDSILFALAGLTVTAIDLVPEAIEIARENAKNAGVTIDFQVGNAENLKFSDGFFDSLFTLSVLHSTDMAKSIPEIYRVLKTKDTALIYIYSNVEKIDGSEKEFISIDEYVDLIKSKGFTLADLYTLPEEEFDEAGEKHLIIVSEVRK